MSEAYNFESEISRIYTALEKIGALGESPKAGFLRAGYSVEETHAMQLIEQEALAVGARARWDAYKNLALEWGDISENVLEFGSHVDTVPVGGNFDGAAGVVCALVAIASLPAESRNGLRLRIWRGEESSTFNVPYIGSLAAFGNLKANNLERKFQGNTLKECMHFQGVSAQQLIELGPTISQKELDSIQAHIELHIEQGNFLEVNQKDIGIVTSIRGPKRFRVVLNGSFDHSGATPMGVAFRRDVNLAIAQMLCRLDLLARQEMKNGMDLVQTCGVINSEKDFNDQHPQIYQNAIPKVSGFGYFGFDLRSNDSEYLEQYFSKVEALLRTVAKEYNVEIEIQLLATVPGVKNLSKDIQIKLEEAAQVEKLKYCFLPSGAGHDAGIVAQQKRSDGQSVPVGMLFIPCKQGKSHCPEEFATPQALAKGAKTLAAFISLSR